MTTNTDFQKRLTDAHNKMCRQVRQYRGIEVCCEQCTSFTIKKIWNRGMGRLELWNIDIKRERILINTSLFNHADKAHLKTLLESVPELKSYDIIGAYFGYPLYYNYGFTSDRLPGERIRIALD